jgi:hypothetical protein
MKEPLRCMRCGEDAAADAEPSAPLCPLCVLLERDEPEPLPADELEWMLEQVDEGVLCCVCMAQLGDPVGYLRMCSMCAGAEDDEDLPEPRADLAHGVGGGFERIV